MFDCHQEEKTFWKTMNPARLHALFNARFRQQERTTTSIQKKQEPISLREYLTGG